MNKETFHVYLTLPFPYIRGLILVERNGSRDRYVYTHVHNSPDVYQFSSEMFTKINLS